jgi:DNA-binding response OmpR family regulator
MIVEDDGPLVELLRYNFETAGYAVETVMHGDEAGQALLRPQRIALRADRVLAEGRQCALLAP